MALFIGKRLSFGNILSVIGEVEQLKDKILADSKRLDLNIKADSFFRMG